MADKPTLAEIENAFLPAKEIADPERFAGRKEEVENLAFALISEGTNIAIIGNRGIGKSSLARQLINFSTGNNDLLNRLEIGGGVDGDFLTIYFACGKSIISHSELLEKLLTNKECLLDWSYDIPKARKSLEKYQPKFNIGFASLGGEKSSETTLQSAQPDHDVETVFTNVVSAIAEQNLARNGLLIVVDEFDQIQNKDGFASFLKALSTNVPLVKFCIVGVAHDIPELIKEHGSADRLFAGGIINLPPMNKPELAEIIRGAEHSISNYIQFDENATNKLVDLAQARLWPFLSFRGRAKCRPERW